MNLCTLDRYDTMRVAARLITEKSETSLTCRYLSSEDYLRSSILRFAGLYKGLDGSMLFESSLSNNTSNTGVDLCQLVLEKQSAYVLILTVQLVKETVQEEPKPYYDVVTWKILLGHLCVMNVQKMLLVLASSLQIWGKR